MEHLPNYEKQERPWGTFERFALNEPCTVKIITVNPGEAFSLQTHHDRDEFWRIIVGSGTVTLNDTQTQAGVGDYIWSPRGSMHRLEAGSNGVQFLEVSFGSFDEDDIERIDDRYGRS